VALNTAYELLNKQPAVVEAPAVEVEQLKKLSERIDDALHRFRQLEIG